MSDIQGAFCKHQCAVQIKYGINVLALSLEYRKKIFVVARGKPSSCPDSFLMDMMDTSNSTEMNLAVIIHLRMKSGLAGFCRGGKNHGRN